MKKLLSIIASLTVCAALTACSATGENDISETESKVIEKRSLDGLKKTEIMSYTISFINTFEDLEATSELIVIGEFIGNSEPCYTRKGYDHTFQSEVVRAQISSCPMKITKVLSGKAQVGQVINVLQREWISDNRFISESRLTPMQMGDEWLFCLMQSSEEEGYDGWWCVEDNKGRYPTKNSESNEVMCFSDYPELGVYDRSDFQEDFYNKLVEKYGI